MKIGPSVDTVPAGTIIIPQYIVDKTASKNLESAKKAVSLPTNKPTNKEADLFREIYGTAGWKVMTQEDAEIHSGEVLPAVTGQYWGDTGLSIEQLQATIEYMKILGVFTVKSKKGRFSWKRWFSKSKYDETETETVCIVSVVGRDLKQSTLQAYLHDGTFGTGSGHDPIWVYIQSSSDVQS